MTTNLKLITYHSFSRQVHTARESGQLGKDKVQQVPSEPRVDQTTDYEEAASRCLLSLESKSLHLSQSHEIVHFITGVARWFKGIAVIIFLRFLTAF